MNKVKYVFFSTIIILLLYFVYFVTYTFVEPKAYDFMTKHVLTEKLPFDNKNVYGSGDIVLVVIDNKTAERYRWPWKRELWCKIFNYFHDYAQPKIVIHDAIFSTIDKDNIESDRKFFTTLSKFDNLVEGFIANVFAWQDEDFGKNYDKKFSDKFSQKNIQNNIKNPPQIYSSMIPFPDEYFNAIKKVGLVTIFQGFIDGNFRADEIVRTSDYLFLYKDKIYTSLAMQAFLTLNNDTEVIANNKYIEFPQLNYKFRHYLTKCRMFTPLKFYKSYYGYSHQKVSALDIMDSYDSILKGEKPIFAPELFKDKIVIIGANVPASEGLVDTKHSPIMSNHPGVDIQATAVDNIIHNDFLKVVPRWINILIVIFGMLFVYYTIRVHELAKAIILTLLAIFTYFALTAVCFYYSIVIYVITPVVMAVVTMIIAYIHRYLIESRNKQKVENALGKYMSEDVMKTVIKNIDNLGLGGKKAVVTVLFSDIRGFTSMSEKMSAEEVTAILNEYFSEMEPIVRKYNGIINKFIGDAVMAIFGEPIQDEMHPYNAVKCGYEMIKKVKELQQKWEKEGKPKIEIGVGINTGEVFVGNIGSVNRMEYTVIGDTVNLASRLESYNKTYNTHILISSSTYEKAKESIEANKISNVEIRGKANKIDIYEVIKIKNDLT